MCLGRIYVNAHDHTYNKTIKPHTCIRDHGRVVRAQVYTATTKCALVTSDKPGQILNRVKAQVSTYGFKRMQYIQVPNEYARSLPVDTTTKRRIALQRERQRGVDISSCPNALTDLVEIPPELVTIKWDYKNECVIKGDNGPRKSSRTRTQLLLQKWARIACYCCRPTTF
jgi:hypothetical protein